jgi:ribosomal protein S27E
MTRTIPSQKTVLIEKPDMWQIDQIYDNNLHISQGDQNVDCPHCYDTMVKIYDSDTIRYRCENCDLIIGESWLLKAKIFLCYTIFGMVSQEIKSALFIYRSLFP